MVVCSACKKKRLPASLQGISHAFSSLGSHRQTFSFCIFSFSSSIFSFLWEEEKRRQNRHGHFWGLCCCCCMTVTPDRHSLIKWKRTCMMMEDIVCLCEHLYLPTLPLFFCHTFTCTCLHTHHTACIYSDHDIGSGDPGSRLPPGSGHDHYLPCLHHPLHTLRFLFALPKLHENSIGLEVETFCLAGNYLPPGGTDIETRQFPPATTTCSLGCLPPWHAFCGEGRGHAAAMHAANAH